MKFTTSSAALLQALNSASGAVPSKSTLPILECILFEKEDDALRLSATDLEISIVRKVGVQFESNGAAAGEGAEANASRVAVPARRLLDTLRALPDLPITFTTSGAAGDFKVVLETDQGRYQMVGYDGADYPALPQLEGKNEIDLDAELLGRAIKKTGFAVSKDALRPAMMGVYFQIEEGEGRTVATDGHRLVRLKMEQMTGGEALSFIVPEKAMTLAGRVAGEGVCTLRVDEGHVGFDFGEARVMARLIDEKYPNYEAVIPTENDKRLVVNREAMLAAVRRVGLYSSSMTNQIRLAIEADRVKISAEDIERSSEAHETVLCEFDGEEAMTIGFNATYLTEVLNNLDAEEVVFALSTPNRAGIVTPQEQAEGEDILMLIMPVMLNTYA